LDNAQHLAHDGGLTGKQQAQREWNAEDPLAHWLMSILATSPIPPRLLFHADERWSALDVWQANP